MGSVGGWSMTAEGEKVRVRDGGGYGERRVGRHFLNNNHFLFIREFVNIKISLNTK